MAHPSNIQTTSLNELKARLSEDVQERMSSSLRRVVEGSDLVLRAPQFEDIEDSKILADFRDEVLSRINPNEHHALLDLEESALAKFGPRSIAKNWEKRKDDVANYFNYPWTKESLMDDADYWLECIKARRYPSGYNRSPVLQDLGSLRPILALEAALSLPRSKGSGLPLLKKKRDVLDVTVSNLRPELEEEWPSMLYTRTQEGGKTRAVMGVPFAQVIHEAQYYRPFLEKVAKKCEFRSALLGPDAVDRQVSHLMDLAHHGGDSLQLLSIDFSSFDQSVSPEFQRAAFHFISSFFQEPTEFEAISRRFREVGLVTPDGVWNGAHGVPSGSTWTNEVDSIVQCLAFIHVWREVNREENEKNLVLYDPMDYIQVQGDDGLYITSRPEEIQQGMRRLGLAVNEEKSSVSPDSCLYLQRYYHPQYRLKRSGIIGGIYPVARALNRLVHMEQFTDFENEMGITGDDYFNIRAISIMENCKYHPLHKELVAFVLKRDRHSLMFSPGSLRAYARAMTAKIPEGQSHKFESNVNGLLGFTTVQMILDMNDEKNHMRF
jgi:hypothetical protein